jgi:hypothetical protein
VTLAPALDGLPVPYRALVRVFFARYFESEITTSVDDVKGSFFWLLAALAVPGMFIPWMMAFDWHLIVLMKGPEALREASQAEKTFYLGLSMVASGLLTSVVWSSLLPDERDALILGAFPVRPGTIVLARLTALAAYILLVAAAMHAVSAVFFGLLLGTKSSALFTLRGVAAHFVASAAAGAAVALMAAAIQGAILAAGGPRLFRRVSAALQGSLVAAMVVGLALLPIVAFSMVHTVRGFGGRVQPWVLSTPPAWFLGLYEWILGTSDPVLLGLARTAALALGLAAAVTVVTFPLAYRRLMTASVERRAGAGVRPPGRFLQGLVVRAAGPHAEARASAEFYAATVTRVDRHRFVVAMALGTGLAWIVGGWKMLEPPAAPAAGWLSLPLSAMVFLVLGLGIAASLPGDIRAAWLFEMVEPTRLRARQALERTILLIGVLPPTLLAVPVFWTLWGARVALVHAILSVAVGLALVEMLIWNLHGVPCARRWNLSGASLGYRIPVYAAAFFLVVIGVPRLEVLLLGDGTASVILALAALTLAALARRVSAAHEVLPSYDDVDPVAGVLRLN